MVDDCRILSGSITTIDFNTDNHAVLALKQIDRGV